jgi:hypothetical protein
MADPLVAIPPGFAALPYELREQIWLDALTEPNLYALNHAQSPDNAHITPSIIPIGRSTWYVGASCREARHLFEQTHIAVPLAAQIVPHRVWFNAQTVLCVYNHRLLLQCFEPEILRSLRIVAEHWFGPVRRAHYTALAGLLGGYVCGDETVIASRGAGFRAVSDVLASWRREKMVGLLFRQIMQPPLTRLSVSAGRGGLAANHAFAILDPEMFGGEREGACVTEPWERAAELPCAEGLDAAHAGADHRRFSSLHTPMTSATYRAIMRWIRPQT